MDRMVIDTNVIVSALRSAAGASYRLLDVLYEGRIEIATSVPLVMEYEYACIRNLEHIAFSESELKEYIDDLCSLSVKQKIFFLWRPMLKDANDEHVLDLAIASRSRFIITYNKKDFIGAKQFGLEILSPKEYLQRIGEIT
jgi:putative PIN family toxin of toxin-antitoxin system